MDCEVCGKPAHGRFRYQVESRSQEREGPLCQFCASVKQLLPSVAYCQLVETFESE